MSAAARKRGLRVMLFNSFLMWAGFFMVIPLISVHYVDGRGWAAASIGLVLAVRQFLQQGVTPLSGVLADRFGARGLICGGMLLRSVGFVLLARADTYSVLMASAVLAALGGGLFESPKAAAIAALTDEENRNRYYSLAGVVGGIGVTAGTQMGALLLSADFSLVALASAGCFFLAGITTLLFLPPVRVATEQNNLTHGLGMALRDRPFLVYTALLGGFWFLWVQFTLSLPLAARSIGGTVNAVGWVYAVNSGMTILLGYPVIKLAGRWLRPLPTLVLGIAVMALGYGSIALAGGVGGLLLSVAVVSGGVLLAFPSQQTVTADLAAPEARGTYIGLNYLALAIGGGAGNLGGGLLVDAGSRMNMPALPWVSLCIVGLLTASGLAAMAVRGHGARPSGDPIPATAGSNAR